MTTLNEKLANLGITYNEQDELLPINEELNNCKVVNIKVMDATGIELYNLHNLEDTQLLQERESSEDFNTFLFSITLEDNQTHAQMFVRPDYMVNPAQAVADDQAQALEYQKTQHGIEMYMWVVFALGLIPLLHVIF